MKCVLYCHCKDIVLLLKQHRMLLIDVLQYYPILLDDDQLTIARARGAICLRENHSTDEQINGFQPAIADWHACMNLVEVSYA